LNTDLSPIVPITGLSQIRQIWPEFRPEFLSKSGKYGSGRIWKFQIQCTPNSIDLSSGISNLSLLCFYLFITCLKAVIFCWDILSFSQPWYSLIVLSRPKQWQRQNNLDYFQFSVHKNSGLLSEFENLRFYIIYRFWSVKPTGSSSSNFSSIGWRLTV
jgi:hypothetical protein